MKKNLFIGEFLGFLEQREARLLSWGFYNVSFGAGEAQEALENEGPRELGQTWEEYSLQGMGMEDLLEEMSHAGLLHRVGENPMEYRTRFAEGVRLFARLRQMFRYQDWSTGPRLVSDIKLHLNPRHYPKRDQSASDCWQDLKTICNRGLLQKETFDALSSIPGGGMLSFTGFQRRAFRRILENYFSEGISASVVSAGTGSGKTKAFYIPAMLGIVTDLYESCSNFTKVIAIYPRNVLLADQLREAISEVSKILPLLKKHGKRSITFGALLGETPEMDWFEQRGGQLSYAEKYSKWKRTQNGWVVPFLNSPVDADQGLIWRDSDRKSGRTCLYRATGSSAIPDIPDGILRLTREQIQSNPPDVLFLSIEMLNREMGNPQWSKAFGVGQGVRGPRLLLLDEVHAYDGLPGAQAAWVLRRWRHWSGGRKLHVVGLSATLRDAVSHMSRVTGIPHTSIREFRPENNELISEGMEYNVIVKGDPSSGASLLATTLQTGMLLTRLLTAMHLPKSDRSNFENIQGDYFYGRKVFGFSDNLDVLNRWYSDMSDAEQKKLAKLRLHPGDRNPRPSPFPSPTIIDRMREDGQIWELPPKLGYKLDNSLRVSRCSSQDPGANTGSDLIVATASLEVGYDDPEVGATLHHKRPISMSSFIQRKGRAGRRRGVRPWTVVVLSDYGGDRWAFQNAERFFEPEIDAIFLPIFNPYVLRIQATYFLIDWLGRRVNTGGPFSYLRNIGYSNPQFSLGRQKAIDILKDILAQGRTYAVFVDDFCRAFARPMGGGKQSTILTKAELDAILWDPPRPILREVIPVLLRKLEARWTLADPDRANQAEDVKMNRPVPQYLPGATFEDLDVSEARIVFPDLQNEKGDRYMSVGRVLFESCPGNISKRYSVRLGEVGRWLAFSGQLIGKQGRTSASVADLYPLRLFLESVDNVNVYQAQEATLEHRPANILDTSKSNWEWENRLRPIGCGLQLPIFDDRIYSQIVRSCVAYLHRDHSCIDVLRYARMCKFEIRQKRGSTRGSLHLERPEADGTTTQEAIGFRQQVDGVLVRLKGEHLQNLPSTDAEMDSRFRPDYFLQQILACEILSQHINPFLAEWLWQTSLAMLGAVSLRKGCELEEACEILKGKRVPSARKVLDTIFQMRDVSEDPEEEGRVKKNILELWSNPTVCARMEELESTLWETPGEEYRSWLKRRYVATFAQAFRSAAISRLKDIAADDLMVDVAWDSGGDANIYLTEMNSGGLGQMESILGELRGFPDQFHEALHHALLYCPRKYTVVNLMEILQKAVEDKGVNQVADSFVQVRNARGYRATLKAKEELEKVLSESGLGATRQIIVALVTRLLGPGSSRRSDVLNLMVNQALRRKSLRLGMGIDPRVFAYICTQYEPLFRRLTAFFKEVSGGEDPTRVQVYSVLQRLLLADCEDSCRDCLDNPHRYGDIGRPSRALARAFLHLKGPEIRLEEYPTDWNERVRESLRKFARVTVIAGKGRTDEMAKGIMGLLAEELDVDYLLMPISVVRFDRDGTAWRVILKIKGALNG